MDIKDIEAKIAKLQKELAYAQKEKAEFEQLGPVEQLAISMHECFCNANHTDGCGWHYEISKGKHDWTGYAHMRYYEKAVRVHAEFHGRTNEIKRFLQLAKEINI